MKNNKKNIASAFLIIFVGMIVSLKSHADILGYYAEGSVGQTINNLSVYDGFSDFEGDDVFLSLVAGARFNDNFAVELGYFEFGEQSEVIKDSLLPQQSLDVSIATSVLGINARGNYGITPRWFLSGAFGFGFFNVDLEQRNLENQKSYREKDRDFGMYYGVSSFYRFSRQYAVTVEFQQFFFDTPLFNEALFFSAASVGFRYYF